MDQKLPVPIVNVATPLPFCVPLLLAGCQSWKNWLGIVVKLWIWSGSIIGCQFSHVPRRMHCKSFFKTVYCTQVTSPSIHAIQLINNSSSSTMFKLTRWSRCLQSTWGHYHWHDDMTFPGRPAVHLHLEPSVTKHWRHILGTWLAPPQICLGGSCVP